MFTRTKHLRNLEAKFRNIVSHATGGATSDITRPTNDIAVDISMHVSRAFQAGGFDPLPCMCEAERKVLDLMGTDSVNTLAQMAADAGLKESEVRAIVQVFVLRGFAEFGHLGTDVDSTLRGRGYFLSTAGERLQNRLRFNASVAAHQAAAAEAEAEEVEA